MANIKRVHQGEPSRPSLIFIHGLNGDALNTWVGPGTSGEDCWLHWAGQDARCDSWTVSYDAAASRWQGQAMPLPDQGDQIASLLALEPELKDRELILIGHSLGGLVIKSLITQSLAKDDGRFQALARKIRGVMFVASPHQGSQLASLMQAVQKVARPNPQIEQLRNHDPHLRQLGGAFRHTCTELQIAVEAVAETQEVTFNAGGIGGFFAKSVGVMIVDQDSANPGIPGLTVTPMAKNHFSICKPGRDDEDMHIRHLLTALVERVTQPRQSTSVSTPNSALPTEPTLLPTKLDGRLIGPQDARLQPESGRVLGREAIISELLNFLRGAGDAMHVTAKEVSAVAGMGKTEVCKAALKIWLQEQPEAVAYYVQLPDRATADTFVACVTEALGLRGIESWPALATQMQAGLYYLDNLEGLAEDPEGIKLLGAFKLLPGVRVLASSRVSLHAMGRTLELNVLAEPDALALFRFLWTGPDSLPDDAALRALVVDRLGCHPLSLSLLARLGQSYAFDALLDQWKILGVRLAADAAVTQQNRHNNLEVSLALTAQTLTNTSGALALWGACAPFAHGLTENDLKLLIAPLGAQAHIAREVLVRHHVLRRRENVFIMLPPLARYALEQSAANGAGFYWKEARVLIHELLAKWLPNSAVIASSDVSLQARRWVVEQFEGIDIVLRQDMNSVCMDPNWVQEIHEYLVHTYQFVTFEARDLLNQLQMVLPRPVSALQSLGILESRLGQTDRAHKFYEQALTLYKKEGNDLGQASTMRSLGDLESRLGNVDPARELYERALALYKKENVNLGQANTLRSLGDLECRLGKVDRARVLYEQALALYKKEGDDLGQANTQRSRGDLECRLGEVDRARELYEQALALYQKENAGLGQANTLRSLGDLEYRLDNVVRARELYERALPLYQKERDDQGQANTLYSLGDLESQLGKLDRANQLYEQALALFKKENAGLGQANTLRAQGDLEYRLDKVDQARELYEQAVTLFKKESDDLGLANTLRSLGDLESQLGKIDQARVLYEQALSLYTREQDAVGEAYTFAELARCWHAQKEVTKADNALLQAFDKTQQTKAPAVWKYVAQIAVALKGSPEAAQAWLESHDEGR